MSSPAPQPNPLMAIMMMACAAISIALLWGLLRFGSQTMHPLFMVFWRSLIGAMVLAPFFMRTGFSGLRTARLGLHFMRSVFGFGAMAGIFYSIAHIPLGQAIAVNYSAPLLASVGAVFILGEVARRHHIVALVAGFVGMLIVVRPGLQDLSLGTGAAVFGAVCMAATFLCIKKLSESEHNAAIIVYGNMLSLPLALFVALDFWQPMGWYEIGLLVVIGIMSTVSQWFLNQALSLADASAVLPVDFLRIVFVTILGAVFFDEALDAFAWLGAGIILAASVYIARRETDSTRQQPVQPPA